MCNRLTQFLHVTTAALPEVPRPEPPRGHSHFAVATFAPEGVENWLPRHAEDAPAQLDYEQVSFQGRYHALHAALEWILAFNRPRLAEHQITHVRPSEWALLAFVDGTAEAVHLDYARNVSPLRYYAHEVFVQPKWRPANLLDAPASNWSDEFCGLSKHQHATLDGAVRTAIKANRKFRPGKKRNGFPPKWSVVLAVEAESANRFDTLCCIGEIGSLTVITQHRFHLVGADWPLSPATLAEIGGGA